MHARIVCIGNSYLAADAAGQAVHDLLARLPLPDEVELIAGGTAGLRLLPVLEGCQLVIFVDAVSGFLPAPGIVTLEPAELEVQTADLGHGAGLAELLVVASAVLNAPLPQVRIVGIEGPCDDTVRDAAARLCLSLISGSRSAAGPPFPCPSTLETADGRSPH